jgi:hypothetical protein
VALDLGAVQFPEIVFQKVVKVFDHAVFAQKEYHLWISTARELVGADLAAGRDVGNLGPAVADGFLFVIHRDDEPGVDDAFSVLAHGFFS